MLFYQLTVARKQQSPVQPASGEAKVMLRVDSDVETETSSAVRYLEKRGWEVTGVRHAQMAEAIDEFAPDRGLVALYQRAEREGIACIIPASESV
ncbi:MAG TPA: hypothetical protein VIM69_14055 [Opitutaceae bacterium]